MTKRWKLFTLTVIYTAFGRINLKQYTPNELRFGSSLSDSFFIKNTEQNSAIKSSNYYKKILYHQKSINFDFVAFLFFKNGLNTGQNSILQTFVQSLQNRVPRVQVLLPLPKEDYSIDTNTMVFLFCQFIYAEGLEQGVKKTVRRTVFSPPRL